MKTWSIWQLNPAPSMNKTKNDFNGTYKEAVAYARKLFAEAGRAVSVHGNSYDVYPWFYISGLGETNRNLNAEI